MTTTRLRRAQKELKDTTIRDFSGGWNVIDNELTLDPKFSPVEDNVYRAQDGSKKVRQGTRLFAFTSVADDTEAHTFGSVSATIATTNTSANVVITLGASSPVTFNLGQRIQIAGITTTYGGIVPANINGNRVVIAANHTTGVYTVTAGAAATSTTGATALDATATFSRADTVTNSPVIGIHYFDTYLITVHASGEISRTDANGATELIWDDDIASILSASGWSGSLTFASFAVFGGPASGSASLSAVPKLLVCNGTDRSVVIDFTVSGASNTFVLYNDTTLTASTSAAHDSPAGVRYIAAMPEFCVMAGIPGYESVLAISDQNSPFIWPDISGGTAYSMSSIETVIDLARVINISDPTIRGITRFRDKLVVGFDNAVALVEFSIDSSGNAAHAVVEVIDGQGCIAHKSMISIGDDVYMTDIVGIPSLQQALYTGGVRTQRVSQLIDPEIQALIQELTIGEAEDFIFSVWNPLESQYMAFIPASMSGGSPTSYHAMVYTYIPALKVRAWSRYKGWNFSCGCASQLGRVFFAEGDEIYVYGTEIDPITVDYLNGATYGVDGTGIVFDWELPWADFDKRINIKKSEYIALETAGANGFTISMYIDNIRLDPSDNSDAPALTTDFIGTSGSGYGVGPQVYGGGPASYDDYLWKWPAKFKIAKIRFMGTATKALNFISFSILYKEGGYRR